MSYYLEHKEERKQYQKKYNLNNLEKIKESWKNYRSRNKKKIKIYKIKNKEKINKWRKKNYLRPEVKEKIKQYQKNHPEINLKVQIKILTNLGKILKLPYKEYSWALQAWSVTVKKQQGNQCVICGSINKLNAHHILHKVKHPELSLNPNNGIILCINHHQEVHGHFN